MHYFSEFIGVPIFIQVKSNHQLTIETTYIPQFVAHSSHQEFSFHTPYKEYILNYKLYILTHYYPIPGRLEPILFGVIGNDKEIALDRFNTLSTSYSDGFNHYHNLKFSYMTQGKIARLTIPSFPYYTISDYGLYNQLLFHIGLQDSFYKGYGYVNNPIIHAVSLHLKVNFHKDFDILDPELLLNPMFYPPFLLESRKEMFK